MNSLLVIIILCSCSKVDSREIIQGTDLKESSSMNRIYNGGGENTTDWKGLSLAEGWSSFNSNCKILTSNGNRSQYISGKHSQFVLMSPKPAKISGAYHTLSFRYKSTTDVYTNVRFSERCGSTIYTCEPSHEWKEVCIPNFWAPTIIYIKWYNNIMFPGEFIIDNVNLY